MERQRDWHDDLKDRLEAMKATPIPDKLNVQNKALGRPSYSRTSLGSLGPDPHGYDDGAKEYDPCPEIDYHGNEI